MSPGRASQPHQVPVEPVDLFAYGSLQFPEVMRVLLGRTPPGRPAQAAGWRVAALPGRVYPALVPAPSTDLAAGQLVTGLHPAEWRILDAFEDQLYDLSRLTLTDGRIAWAYVYSDGAGQTAGEWDMHAFERDHLADYLKRCAVWRHDVTTRMPDRP